jgi:hypothetical protein
MVSLPSPVLQGRRAALSALLLGVLGSWWPGAASAQKTDVVVIINGDVITGEVKGLDRGKLDYNTDDVGRLSIKWEKVIGLTSTHFFDVEVSSGARYYGQLSSPQNDGTVLVMNDRADTLRIRDVVSISRLDAGLLQRTKAFVDAGYTFAKANSARTWSFSGQADYRGPKVGGTLSFDSYAQAQTNSPTTTRNTAALSFIRYLPNRYSGYLLTQVEQNDELNLDLRFTAGGAGGRTLHQSNRSELIALVGLVVASEQFSSRGDSTVASSDTAKVSLEGLVYFAWDAFRFDSPKLDMSTAVTLFPSISSLGRLRGQLSLRLKYELVKDFNVGISLTDNFDTRPPDTTAEKNDFVTSLTIGWSYRR